MKVVAVRGSRTGPGGLIQGGQDFVAAEMPYGRHLFSIVQPLSSFEIQKEQHEATDVLVHCLNLFGGMAEARRRLGMSEDGVFVPGLESSVPPLPTKEEVAEMIPAVPPGVAWDDQGSDFRLMADGQRIPGKFWDCWFPLRTQFPRYGVDAAPVQRAEPGPVAVDHTEALEPIPDRVAYNETEGMFWDMDTGSYATVKGLTSRDFMDRWRDRRAEFPTVASLIEMGAEESEEDSNRNWLSEI